MKFIIDKSVIEKCGGGSAEYWFSYKDYVIKNISEFNDIDRPENIGQIEFLVSLGIIPFLNVSNEEIMRAFVKENGSKKLNDLLDKVESENYMDTFWKYYNAYSELKDKGLIEFSDKYIKRRLAEWCTENNIEYEFKLD